jgi:hypothetical protein
LAESLKDRPVGADTLSRMSDRAKARFVAAGLSLVLSAQVAVIIVGGLVLATRLGAFGPSRGGLGAVTLSQPPGLIITGNVEGPGDSPAPGQEPPGAPPVDQASPPNGPCIDCGPGEPVVGVTISVDFPVIGSFDLPLRIGTSSGDNVRRTVRVRKVAVVVSLSRHPLRDLLSKAKKRADVDRHHPILKRRFDDLRDDRGFGDDDRRAHGHGLLGELAHTLTKGRP